MSIWGILQSDRAQSEELFLSLEFHRINWKCMSHSFQDETPQNFHFPSPINLYYTRQFFLQVVSQFSCERNRVLLDKLLESCYTGQRSHVQKGVVSLGDAKRCCDASCRDDVTLRNDWKICCSVARRDAQSRTDFYFLQRRVAATKMLRGMPVAGYVTLGNFSCNFCRNKIARQLAGKIA